MGGWYKICSTLQPKNWSIVLVRVQCVLVSENDRLSQFIGIKHAFVARGTPLTFTTFQSPECFVYSLIQIQIHVTCVCLFVFFHMFTNFQLPSAALGFLQRPGCCCRWSRKYSRNLGFQDGRELHQPGNSTVNLLYRWDVVRWWWETIEGRRQPIQRPKSYHGSG